MSKRLTVLANQALSVKRAKGSENGAIPESRTPVPGLPLRAHPESPTQVKTELQRSRGLRKKKSFMQTIFPRSSRYDEDAQ